MKRAILLVVVVVLLLSACGPSGYMDGYSYTVNARIVTYYCKNMDEEKRVAYDCIDNVNQSTAEYHLALTDSWSKQ